MATKINDLLDAFIACNSLANANKLVAHAHKHPMSLCFLTEDHAGQVRSAEAIVADAKDPSKLKQAMQRELRARFKNLNIDVI